MIAPACVQAFDRGRVILSLVIVQNPRAARRPHALRADVVFDRDRHALKFAFIRHRIEIFCPFERVVAFDRKKAVELRIEPFGVVERYGYFGKNGHLVQTFTA